MTNICAKCGDQAALCRCGVHGARQAASALTRQTGGTHYKGLPIQPVEYIHANGIGFFEGNVIKYVTRWREKGGVQDLEKARHYIDLLIELEGKGATPR